LRSQIKDVIDAEARPAPLWAALEL
jgi:hypothetical protein